MLDTRVTLGSSSCYSRLSNSQQRAVLVKKRIACTIMSFRKGDSGGSLKTSVDEARP